MDLCSELIINVDSLASQNQSLRGKFAHSEKKKKKKKKKLPTNGVSEN
jgi:hypothetical protein